MRRGLVVMAAMLAAAVPDAGAAVQATVAVDAAAVGGQVPPIGTNVMLNGGNLADPDTGAPIGAMTSFLAQHHRPGIVRWLGHGANCYDPTNTDRTVRQQQVNLTNHRCEYDDYNGFQFGDLGNALAQINPQAQAVITANPCFIRSANPLIGPSRAACDVIASGQGTQACALPPAVCPGAQLTADWARRMHAAGTPHRFWEIGNEVFANGNVPATMYRSIVNAYASAIKGADPDALVGANAKDFGTDREVWDAAAATSGADYLATHLYWPNRSDVFASLGTDRLPIGYRRIQNWDFEVAAAGSHQVSVDARTASGEASLTIAVDPRPDGTAAATLTRTINATTSRTTVSVPALAAGRHQLSVQVAPAAGGLGARPRVQLGHGWVCATSCRAIDLGLYDDDNPYAIAHVHNRRAVTRTVTASEPATLQITAYGVPADALGACPTLDVQVDGGPWRNYPLARAGGTVATGNACHSFGQPLTLTGPELAAGSHRVKLAVKQAVTGEVAVLSVAALRDGRTVGRADLSPNEGGRHAFARFTYAGLGSETDPGPVRDRLETVRALAAANGKGLMVSEFNTQYLSHFQASQVQGETLMAALYDAAAIQMFTRTRSPELLGIISWALDNMGFRTVHCAPDSTWDLPWERTCVQHAPRNAALGWVLTMLNGHLHDRWVRTDVTAPSFTVDEPLFDADGIPTSENPNSTTATVQALATRGTGVVDLQLVNFAAEPATTTVRLTGAAASGTATLRSLGGDPYALNGCRLNAYNNPFDCTPAALAPGPPQNLPAAGEMTVTLPASSFSVLTVPTS